MCFGAVDVSPVSRSIASMSAPFIGPEALAAGNLTRGQLRARYVKAQPRIYLPKNAARTLEVNTIAAWLWTDRRAIIAGRAAAALHGVQWIEDSTPVELIGKHRRRRVGVVMRDEKIQADEICRVGDLNVTTPTRTALDLARFLPRKEAVPLLDALAGATGVDAASVLELAARYPRLRGMPCAREALDLMDPGGQSPRETALRLLLIDAGYPRPRTQIKVTDGFSEAFLDMGFDGPKIGLDYDGKQHASDRARYVKDIGRSEMIDAQGWIDIHVVAEHRRAYILHRVREAFARRGLASFSTPGS